MPDPELNNAPLGRDVTYPDAYDPDLLFSIDRATNRASLDLPATWHGADIWNAYELSWLDSRGKPVVALGQFIVPQDSPRLIESKSFKLYLNSLNQTRMPSSEALRARIAADVSAAAGASVGVTIWPLREAPAIAVQALPGLCIDDAPIDITSYQPRPDLLRCAPGGHIVTESLVSDLLKSNCPVTGQPDWGSVQIRYTGAAIDRDSLLAYIVSMRQHTEFHEHCVEKMFCDLYAACKPERLFVYARYTRRGGLDINPWRSTHAEEPENTRTLRQ